jgi:hypothetical protein
MVLSRGGRSNRSGLQPSSRLWQLSCSTLAVCQLTSNHSGSLNTPNDSSFRGYLTESLVRSLEISTPELCLRSQNRAKKSLIQCKNGIDEGRGPNRVNLHWLELHRKRSRLWLEFLEGLCLLELRSSSWLARPAIFGLSPPARPPDWSVRRRLEYVAWARDVVAGLRGTNAWLEAEFDRAAEAADWSVEP